MINALLVGNLVRNPPCQNVFFLTKLVFNTTICNGCLLLFFFHTMAVCSNCLLTAEPPPQNLHAKQFDVLKRYWYPVHAILTHRTLLVAQHSNVL